MFSYFAVASIAVGPPAVLAHVLHDCLVPVHRDGVRRAGNEKLRAGPRLLQGEAVRGRLRLLHTSQRPRMRSVEGVRLGSG